MSAQREKARVLPTLWGKNVRAQISEEFWNPNNSGA